LFGSGSLEHLGGLVLGVGKKTGKPIKPRKPEKNNRKNRTEKKTD
jgi:hypothetical protein